MRDPELSTHAGTKETAHQRRFGAVARLLGDEPLERLRAAHVCVIGLGGVGSWAVEALARSGIGRLTLIDLDDVCISNVNRQLHALDGELGKPKVEVMARRIRTINPECTVYPLQMFFLKSNAAEILSVRFDAVLDAIDSPARKCLLIAHCRDKNIPVVVTGASAGRRDPTQIEVADLAFSSHDRLLQEVRKKLRVRHGFPRRDEPFGIDCVMSREPVLCLKAADSQKDLRLDCETGLGTASFVTGAFGLIAASRIVEKVIGAGASYTGPCALRASD
jgi:tRNA A37 threonylcarbamoyladenosine dehydratase